MSADRDRRAGWQRLLAGGEVDRRTALCLASQAVAVLGAPALLAACGRTVPAFVDRVGYQLDAGLGEGSTALAELVPLLERRARSAGMDPVLQQVAPGRLPALLREQTALGPFDPQTNSHPPANRLVVLSAVEPVTLEPIAAQAIARGVKVVPYPRPMRHQTAAIVFDTRAAAEALAGEAAAWARGHLAGGGPVLLALPSAECLNENALCADASDLEQAWRSTLAREASDLQILTSSEAIGELGGAETLAPFVRSEGIRIVLAWNDEVAAGLARELRRQPPAGTSAGDIYVASLGAPTIASRATFTELEQQGPLRAVLAARLSALAGALVDLPRALLNGESARNITLEPAKLTPRSTALAAYMRDYPAHPPAGTVNYEAVPLNPSAFK